MTSTSIPVVRATTGLGWGETRPTGRCAPRRSSHPSIGEVFEQPQPEEPAAGRPQQEQDALAANQEPARTLLPSVDKRHHRRQDAVQQRHPVPAGQG